MPGTARITDGFGQTPGRRGSAFTTVTGYIVTDANNHDGSDDDDNEDDEEDNWLDYSQMRDALSAGTFISRKKARYCRVVLRDFHGGKHPCRGRFPLTDPWWKITVVKDRKNEARGPIVYALRTDSDGIRDHNLVVTIFIKALRAFEKDSDSLVELFEKFISNTGQKDRLTFQHMESLFQQFARQLEMGSHDQTIFRSMLTTELVQSVMRAHNHPELLSFLCRLFPQTFVNCLIRPPHYHLPNMETAAKQEPWVFGFSKILFTRFRLCGIEASVKAFENAGLLDEVPTSPYKDALYIYHILKHDAAHDGHTYVSFPDLQRHRLWASLGYAVTDWLAALAYLSSNSVTYEERFDSKRNIFLFHNWKAEEDIAKGLQEVLSRGLEKEARTWNVDFSSADLERLRGDKDQWNAAQKVASSPLTVLSGKGGCGKTTVVTQLIRHVCLQTPVPEDPATQDSQSPSQIPDKREFVDISNGHTQSQHCPSKADIPSQDAVSDGGPAPSSQVVTELLSQLIDNVSASQSSPGKSGCRQSRLLSELSVDLIKYLSTSGDTALSDTSIGKRILLTAPTGKAAKLLGHKASMKSYTLHHVIYSYRAFVKVQAQKQREAEASQKTADVDEAGKRNKGEDGKDEADAATQNSATDEEGAWKFADTELLVVDECSLVSLRLFAALLSILIDNTPLCKVILLGDIRQLPSIEPGNFLSDVFTTMGDRGLSVELTTNHRSESELIVSNATRISHRQLPHFDPARNFHFWGQEDREDCADTDRDIEIRRMLTSCPELESHVSSQFVSFRRAHCEAVNELCCQHYNQHSIRKADSKGSKPRYDFQVGDKICFRKNGQVMNYGEKLCTFLPPAILRALGMSSISKKEKKEKQMDAATAAKKVMENEESGAPLSQPAASVHVTDYGLKMESLSPPENATKADPEPGDGRGSCSTENAANGADSQAGKGSEEQERRDKMKQGEIRLCNGEVFFIMHEETELAEGANREQRYLYLSDRDPLCPRVYCCSLRQLKRECHMHHAWVRTIHTYQGSESDTVVYIVGEPVAQTWKHVYTAVTRGRKAVFVMGKESSFCQAVRKSDIPRRSRLSKRLTSMMKDIDMPKLHAWVRATNDKARVALLTDGSSQPSSSAPLTLNSTILPLVSLPTPASVSGAETPAMADLIDTFPDSDDSWVNMSASCMVDPEGFDTDETTVNSSAVLNLPGNSYAVSADTAGTSSEVMRTPTKCMKMSVSASPGKRQQLLNDSDIATTPKKSCVDPIDSIVSPVRRSLKI